MNCIVLCFADDISSVVLCCLDSIAADRPSVVLCCLDSIADDMIIAFPFPLIYISKYFNFLFYFRRENLQKNIKVLYYGEK